MIIELPQDNSSGCLGQGGVGSSVSTASAIAQVRGDKV